MRGAERFFDTNVLLYLFSADAAKADRVESLLAAGGTIGVRVLNEFAAVAVRKLGMTVAEAREALGAVAAACTVTPLTLQTHELALQIAERYRFSVYDALIVAAALEAGCKTLYTEDLQHGQVIEDTLTVRNPFRG
jgi:predicted nucleic acid-binding protein